MQTATSRRCCLGLLALLFGSCAMPAVATVVYNNNFEDLTDPLVEWTPRLASLTPGTPIHPADRFLGRYNSDTVILNLASLPEHTEATVSFDLYIIHSWDGNRVPPDGPDVWDLSVVGGPTLLHTTFSNGGGHHQAYPDWYPSGDNPPFTGITEPYNSLGFTGGSGDDTTYGGLTFTFPHSAESLALSFAGIRLQNIEDESWGIDNVTISLGPDCSLPFITSQPRSQTECGGTTITLDVEAAGMPAFAYQWRKEGVSIAGATSSILLIEAATPGDSGTYDVEVRNECDYVISDAAVVVVWPIGTGDINGDGSVNGEDIGRFVETVLRFPNGPPNLDFCAADMNSDGLVNFADVGAFVGSLVGP